MIKLFDTTVTYAAILVPLIMCRIDRTADLIETGLMDRGATA
jgi:hypothetical protein